MKAPVVLGQRLLLTCQLALTLDQIEQGLHFNVGGVACTKARGCAFEHLAHGVELHHRLPIKMGDDQAITGFMLKNAFTLKTADRVTHGCATQVEPVCDFDFHNPVARRELPLLYGVAQASIGMLAT